MGTRVSHKEIGSITRGRQSLAPRLSLTLDRALVLPSLRVFLSHRYLISVDEQAIALALALAAYAAFAYSCATTSLARSGQFFIHSICLGR